PRCRGPVDAPQRLALLVVPDTVEVEADGPPEQKPSAVLGARPTLEEEPFELDEVWVDDERLLLVERHPLLREAEGIADREAHRLEGVVSSWNVVEPVGAPVTAPLVRPKLDDLLPDPPDPLMGSDVRQRHPGLALKLELDPDVL